MEYCTIPMGKSSMMENGNKIILMEEEFYMVEDVIGINTMDNLEMEKWKVLVL